MQGKVTAPRIRAMKAKSEPIVCITAYDAVTGLIADESEVDLILVGDSVGNVVLGYETTIPVSLDDMVHHTRATRRGVTNALLVGDMPFGTYQSSTSAAVDAAVALAKAGAEAVKLEGAYFDEVRAIVKAGLPVMGHLGMTPQSVNQFGGFKVQGKGEAANELIETAKRLEDAGVFSMVLELVPAEVAAQVTAAVGCPTIGIGAGAGCDGQIQVFHDVVGLNRQKFKHAKQFAQGYCVLLEGAQAYAKEVRDKTFPSQEHSF
jgi:3-methyl-2-oxobutanoate hydroxymethyltransferase